MCLILKVLLIILDMSMHSIMMHYSRFQACNNKRKYNIMKKRNLNAQHLSLDHSKIENIIGKCWRMEIKVYISNLKVGELTSRCKDFTRIE